MNIMYYNFIVPDAIEESFIRYSINNNKKQLWVYKVRVSISCSKNENQRLNRIAIQKNE